MTDTVLPTGTRVVEWGQRASTAWCGKILAGLGADVIKVEVPPLGDPARRTGPFLADRSLLESSARFTYLNLGKRAITLDPMANDHTRGLFELLLDTADIVLCDSESCPPGGPASGTSSQDILERHPRLIVVHLSPYGLSGPKSTWRGDDLTIFHAGGEGIMVADGLDDFSRPPLKAAGSLASYDAGSAAAAIVLAIIFGNLMSGSRTGEHVEISELDVALGTNRLDVPRWANEAAAETRETQVLRFNVVACRDGVVDMMAPEDAPWAQLKSLLSGQAWVDLPEFASRALRDANRREFNDHLSSWTQPRSAIEVGQALRSCGIAAEVILDMHGLLESKQYEYRDFLADVRAGEQLGRAPHLPFLVDGKRATPTHSGARAPYLGEHTEQILVGEGLLDSQTFAEFRHAGVA